MLLRRLVSMLGLIAIVAVGHGVAQAEDGPSTTMYGQVVLVGSQHFDDNGDTCEGTGDFAPLHKGSEVLIIGRSSESSTSLSAGRLNDDGRCVFRFNAPAYDSSEYTFAFDDDLYTQCPDSHVPTTGKRIDASLQFGGDNRYCLKAEVPEGSSIHNRGDVVSLNGVVFLHGATTDGTAFGVDCRGVGEFSDIGPGVDIHIDAEEYPDIGPYEIVHGRGNDEGACELPFGGDIHAADTYAITVGESIDLECSAEDTYEWPEMTFLHVHVSSDGETVECVRPNLD